jgi:hypothetical protein
MTTQQAIKLARKYLGVRQEVRHELVDRACLLTNHIKLDLRRGQPTCPNHIELMTLRSYSDALTDEQLLRLINYYTPVKVGRK